ncbi:MAG: hypothetical protein ACOYNI_04920 [Acidimicrobiia bacterium]
MANQPSPLAPGVATGIGSLPHLEPVRAARMVLHAIPQLPAAPQLPHRSSHEQMIVQWLRALPEVSIDHDGTVELRPHVDGPINTGFDLSAHGGLLAFVAAASDAGVSAVKFQTTGPLTLALALNAAGMALDHAIDRAVELAAAWGHALVALAHAQLAAATSLVVFDEPALVAWARGRAPMSADAAVDALAVVVGSVAVTHSAVGVHACGDADLAIAVAGQPDVVLLESPLADVDAAPVLASHLERGGWIGWGAIPTDAPVRDSVDFYWRALLAQWDTLSAQGCDGDALRDQAIVHPACGLAGHDESQAEHILGLACALGERVRRESSSVLQ